MTQVELPSGMTVKDLERVLAAASKAARGATLSDDSPIFTEIEKTEKEIIRVYRSTYKGREVLSIRAFWRNDQFPDWQFGKGVNFDYEMIDSLIEGLTKMKDWCEEHPDA
jgi:hypothetical protein